MKKIIALLIALTSTAHGYLTPQYLNANQLQGVNISATAPTLNQVLLYDGTNWAPTTIATGGGTVTSVAMSVPSFLSVSGSPITSSGTLAVSLSGTALPVANGGTGTTTAFTSGSVLFADGGGVYSQDNANYFWDATNHRLGLGNAAPSTTLDVTGSQNITSTSANALTVGPNGATNPVLQIDASTASSVTGIKITGAAAGGGSKIEAISSATNEDIILGTKGTSSSVKLQVGASNKYVATAQNHTFSVSSTDTASTVRFGYTGATDTSLTASTEAPSVYFNIGQTRQHNAGAMSLQRDFRVTPSTHSFVGASTLTNAAGFAVDGAPIAGTNATITNSSTIYSAGQAVGAGVTNSYGLNINANTGATNNYSAIFNGGSVGIGTSSPLSLLNLQGFHSSVAETVAISLFNSKSTSNLPAYGFGLGPTSIEGYLTYRAGTAATSAFGHKWFVNDVELMRLRGDGKLGIGLSAPSSILHTYENNTGTGNSNGLTIEQAGTGDALMHYLLTGVQRYTMGIDNSDADKFKIGTNADLGISNLLTITNTGLVGIGTSSPAYPLEVQGLARITGANSIVMDPATGTIYTGAGLGNSITQSNGKIMTPATGPFIERNIADANPALLISNTSATSTGDITQFKSNGTVKVVVSYAGNVGIGTTSPGSTLHVAGSMQSAVNTVTANTTLDITYSSVRGDATSGAITITLPACVTAILGRVYRVIKIDSSGNAVTVGRTGSDTINGATTSVLSAQYNSGTYICGAAGAWDKY